ncbi:MAG: riboflavin synthase [Candidatus Pacebacteria bacterium]|jgi:riboflavin synthase|nr:riboflavin synthase [Candidatus Paceibacterota bacterium]
MFTGIIKDTGRVQDISEDCLVIRTESNLLGRLWLGASVAIDGICLTVTGLNQASFSVQIMPETIRRTNLRHLQGGDQVNLELPATPESFLAGHIVQGHIDGTARVMEIVADGNSHRLKFEVAPSLARYIVSKGSIAVNGVSLTVIDGGESYFTVGVVPHTWISTMFHRLKIGDFANIEVDVLAKYVEKIMNH